MGEKRPAIEESDKFYHVKIRNSWVWKYETNKRQKNTWKIFYNIVADKMLKRSHKLVRETQTYQVLLI